MAVSDAILTRLLELHPKIIDLSLDRMHRILALLGHPERKLPPVIHVAGTNGKGSTVAFTRAIMEAAGLKVHSYTSPHLVRFHERIRIAGELISEADLSALLEECEHVNAGVPITFFEITTAAAFLAFSRSTADYLILEVGLGGRLDATNVVDAPTVTAITSISLDHQQYLGDTIDKIAAEKAGIIKRDRPVVIAAMPPEARATIETIAEKNHALPFIANQDWQSYSQHGRLVFQDERGLLDLPMPSLRGAHQIQNAGNAIAIIRTLNDVRVTDDHIAQGLCLAQWPARMQKLPSGKLHALTGNDVEIWLDGGHNPDAGIALAQAFAELKGRSQRSLTLIWGMLNTKDAVSFIAPLAKIADRAFTITIPEEPNAIPAERLAAAAQARGVSTTACDTLEGALRKAATVAPKSMILICGSLYLAGHVLATHESVAMTNVSGAARR
jgi:dihydrofolate synthase / folylpolyglutamate synthase